MGIIHRAFKVRIYPTQDQETQILKTIGSCRFIYNKMLEERIRVYQELKDQDRRMLYEYKYTTEKEFKQEYPWLSEPEFNTLQQSRIDLVSAYSNFFNSLKGKRKGEKVGFPQFKKKSNTNSFRTPNGHGTSIVVDFDKKMVKLPKLGQVKFRDKRKIFEGKIKQATVSRSTTGKYFVSMLYEQDLVLTPIFYDKLKEEKVIGLDMSMDKFYVDNFGNSPNYKRQYRLKEKRIKKLQRQVSKKEKGSKNRGKAQLRVNKVHEKITNSRKDFTHKLSTSLVKDNNVIVIESLSMKGMSQALNLGKSVMDLGYSEFVRQLQYKSLYHNKILIEADKWYASTKTCSFCGFKKDLLLQERTWKCPNCGREHNRDQNAGQNLKNYGLKELGLEQPKNKPVEKNPLLLKQFKLKIFR